MKNDKEFASFILTHGRPDNCVTYDTLKKSGYTGRIILLVDNLDKTQNEYIERYGDEVIIFDKEEAAKTIDIGDNLPGLGTAMFARNVCFDVAKELGIKYFVQLDDDYTSFQYRFDDNYSYTYKTLSNLDSVFSSILNYLKNTNISSIAIAQGGDFIGGSESAFAKIPTTKRKCMNSWFCATDRRITFSMRMNDDVTTYVINGTRGMVFLTINQVSLNQLVTQSAPGGMTEMYKSSGTYVKTFYTVMASPSSVKVSVINGQAEQRIHHSVAWKNTVPMILRETYKKAL